ncbi:V-type ATP synthase subunit I [Mycobacterium sp. KBS0706]|uniref:V-type ATP synthase subunit I n=1 Tax=Mycobacterium sp. KBS0706 TaxID=2578109 RepID=UPI00110FB525|nr:V-type ATPase 116kDa subunit family protein [Mycobacterium sp. KBS0706]TSD84003.1 V-type ATP synthase subunit I [Mycobacterium sp. KBS0706]
MTIVALRKVSLIGAVADKEKILQRLQEFGGMHLIPLRPAQKELEAVPSGSGRDAVAALRWLTDCPSPRRPALSDQDLDMAALVEAINANRQALLDAEDRKAALLKRIEDVRSWGEFSFPDLDQLGGHRLWFYVVPRSKEKLIAAGDRVVETVHRDRHNSYVVLLSPDEPPVDAMPVPRTRVGAHSLSTLDRHLESIEAELEDLWAERRKLTKWRVVLGRNLARVQDLAALKRVSLETDDVDRVFVAQGWVPVDRLPQVERIAEDSGLAVTVEEPLADERPPTLLANRPGLAGGESLVEFYQTPSYRDWDPSAIVYVSFIIFFGMIMTDVGYGLVLLAVLYLMRRRFEGSETSRRMLVMGYWLMASTAFFGVITGSYFGVTPPPDSLLGRLKIMDLKNVDAMMRITLAIGGLHIIIANLMSARHAKTRKGRLQPLGWCLVVLGGVTAYLASPIPPLAILGIVLIVLGLLVVGVFASDRKVTSAKTLLLRILDGLMATFRLTNIFSDVLSYMRLFALGLAAASLAETINELSGQLVHATPGIGVLIALLVLVIGHVINIGLGLIAGFVHGLRLNVIEFFSWGLKEEGAPFRPFERRRQARE